MITESEVMPLLLAACPGFQSAWEKHLAYWNDDARGAFIDAAEFARYIVASSKNETFLPQAVEQALQLTGDSLLLKSPFIIS